MGSNTKSYLGTASKECGYALAQVAEGIPIGFDAYEKMDAKRARAIAKRFDEMIERRIFQLKGLLRATPGFRRWKPDFCDASIAAIDAWVLETWTLEATGAFVEYVASNDCPATLVALGADASAPQPCYEFGDEEVAHSACVDIGCYLAIRLRARHDWLAWYPASGRTNMEYRMPVLGRSASDYFLSPLVQMVNACDCILRERSAKRGNLSLLQLIEGQLRHVDQVSRSERRSPPRRR